MKTPFVSFSIEVIGGAKGHCYSETHYRLRQLHEAFTQKRITQLDVMGLLGFGQELVYDLKQQTMDTEDGMNYRWTITITRKCDSSD